MNPPTAVRVIDPQGVHGTIDTTAWPLDSRRAEVLVSLESGQQVLVPLEVLVRQEDGSYRLTVNPAASERQHGAGDTRREPPLVLPVIQETLAVDTRPVETGRIRIRKVVHAREELIDPPLLRDEVKIERVPINRVVEGPLPVRYKAIR
jgi:stress response protein YsnF